MIGDHLPLAVLSVKEVLSDFVVRPGTSVAFKVFIKAAHKSNFGVRTLSPMEVLDPTDEYELALMDAWGGAKPAPHGSKKCPYADYPPPVEVCPQGKFAPQFPCIYFKREVGALSIFHSPDTLSWPPRDSPVARTNHLDRGPPSLGGGVLTIMGDCGTQRVRYQWGLIEGRIGHHKVCLSPRPAILFLTETSGKEVAGEGSPVPAGAHTTAPLLIIWNHNFLFLLVFPSFPAYFLLIHPFKA